MNDPWHIQTYPFEALFDRCGLLILRHRHPAVSLWLIRLWGLGTIAVSPRNLRAELYRPGRQRP